MKPIEKEALKAALKENFKLYPEDYPVDPGGPIDEGAYSLAVWLGNTFEQEGGAGDTIEEWIEVAIETFMSYFDFYDKENDERGDTYRYIKSQVVRTLKSHYRNLFKPAFSVTEELTVKLDGQALVNMGWDIGEDSPEDQYELMINEGKIKASILASNNEWSDSGFTFEYIDTIKDLIRHGYLMIAESGTLKVARCSFKDQCDAASTTYKEQ